MATVTVKIELRRVWWLEPVWFFFLFNCRVFEIEPDATKVAKLFYRWRFLPNGKWRDL